MNREQFLERLRESRLLTAEQLRQAAGLPLVPLPAGERGEASAGAFAEALAAEGLLTRFQARMLLQEAPGRLVLGQYHLLDELGRGGMGQVFKAYHTVMGRVVALKVLWPAAQDQDLAQGWFEREVRTLTQLQHPNIVLAYDANEVDGVRFLVMEYVEGQNLQSLVRHRGPLPVPLACDMMAEAAAALQYAHEKGLVHRDVKPANLLVPSDALDGGPAVPDEEGEARPRLPCIKVVDFGLARLRTPAMAETIVLQSPDHFAGTPDYVSPEQCQDVHAVDVRSDLYSLGCTFYFALTGQPPFGGRSVVEKLAHHMMEPPPPITRLRPDAPAGVADIVLRLMAKAPNERFQTPAALAKALRPFCSPPHAAQPFGPGPVRDVPPLLAAMHAEAPGTAVSARDPGTKVAAPGPGIGNLEDRPHVEGRSGKETGAPSEKATENGPGQAPPEESRNEPADRLLRDGWTQWADLVAAIYDRRDPGSWDEPRYRGLHAGLLAACRRGATGSAGRRALFRRLQGMLQPWVSLESLERTEPELLASLLAQCRQVERELGVRRPLRWMSGWLRTFTALVLIFWLLLQAGAAGWRLLSAGGMSGRSLPFVLHSLQLDSLPGQACVLLPLVVLMAVLLVRK